MNFIPITFYFTIITFCPQAGYIVEGIPTPGGSPGGFGVPPPGPIPPIPPPVNPLIPPGPCSPAGYIWMRLYTLVEPITVLVIGVSIFVVVKHLVIPYMLYIARTAMFVDYDKEDRYTSLICVYHVTNIKLSILYQIQHVLSNEFLH